jgi:hypothetical protein
VHPQSGQNTNTISNVSVFFFSVVLAENQECHERRIAACRSDEELLLENTSYSRVLSLFRISSLFPFKRFVEEQSRQLKWSVAACLGTGAIKNVLATGPIAISSSMIDYRWGGSRPIHFLNDARNGHTSPASPAEDVDFEVDDALRSKPISSAVNSSGIKRNTIIESDASSQERATIPEMPLSSTQDTRRHRSLDVASAAEVDAAAAAAIAEAAAAVADADTSVLSSSVEDGSRQRRASFARDGAQQQQQQVLSSQNMRRQSAASLSEIVLLDD